jgi:hypothetical protein
MTCALVVFVRPVYVLSGQLAQVSLVPTAKITTALLLTRVAPESPIHRETAFVAIWSTSGGECLKISTASDKELERRASLLTCAPAAVARGASASPNVTLEMLRK